MDGIVQLYLALVALFVLLLVLRVERVRYSRGSSKGLFERKGVELSSDLVLDFLSPLIWKTPEQVTRELRSARPGLVTELYTVRKVLFKCANSGHIHIRGNGRGAYEYRLHDHQIGRLAKAS